MSNISKSSVFIGLFICMAGSATGLALIQKVNNQVISNYLFIFAIIPIIVNTVTSIFLLIMSKRRLLYEVAFYLTIAFPLAWFLFGLIIPLFFSLGIHPVTKICVFFIFLFISLFACKDVAEQMRITWNSRLHTVIKKELNYKDYSLRWERVKKSLEIPIEIYCPTSFLRHKSVFSTLLVFLTIFGMIFRKILPNFSAIAIAIPAIFVLSFVLRFFVIFYYQLVVIINVEKEESCKIVSESNS